MDLEDRFVISRSLYGYKQFVRHIIYRVRETVSSCESEYMHPNISPEKYARAKRIMELYECFLYELTDEEIEAIEYLHWHRPDEDEPVGYYKLIESSYEKWLEVFFPKEDKMFKKIDKRMLGILLRRIREEHNVSRLRLAFCMNWKYTSLRNYESGISMPTTLFLYNFSQLFGSSIDALLKESEQL